MSSNEAPVPSAFPRTLEAGRCFGGQRSNTARLAAPLGYALLAAAAMLGLTATAATTQGTEASLLVTDYAAARGVEAPR
jgi:hypothetical protein